MRSLTLSSCVIRDSLCLPPTCGRAAIKNRRRQDGIAGDRQYPQPQGRNCLEVRAEPFLATLRAQSIGVPPKAVRKPATGENGGMEEEEQERPRPKIVDKRISAGGHTGKPQQSEPATPQPRPIEEPRDPAEGGATPGESTAPVWTPEQEAEAKRIVDEIVRTPSLDWVVHSAVNLANVAGTKIETGAVEDAALAIDALAALITGLQGKLGEAETPLRQTLAQLQLAYSQRAAPPPTD
jgi:hypothetical protein